MTDTNDYGFTTKSAAFFTDATEQALAAREAAVRTSYDKSLTEANKRIDALELKLGTVNQLMTEFLDKLQTNPQDEYIHWPNRSVVIRDLKSRLKSICSLEQ